MRRRTDEDRQGLYTTEVVQQRFHGDLTLLSSNWEDDGEAATVVLRRVASLHHVRNTHSSRWLERFDLDAVPHIAGRETLVDQC